MSDYLKDFWKNLEKTLRYLAAGFILLIVLRLLNLGESLTSTLKLHEEIILALFSGVLFYGLHVCGIFQIINCANRAIILKRRREIKRNYDPKESRPYDHWGYYLDLERWKRRGKESPIQRELDKWYPIIHFLFCSSYIMIAASSYCIIRKEETSNQLLPFIILFLGLLSFIVAFVSDYRATKVEFWVSIHNLC